MKEFKFEITEHIGLLSESARGWKKEITKVKWNDNPEKYDIREWSPDYTKMGKGVTLSNEEWDKLKGIVTSS